MPTGQRQQRHEHPSPGARTFFVTINLDRLRNNLSSAEGRDLSEAEVKQWLVEAEFRADGNGWLVSEDDLGQLQSHEVLGAEVVAQRPRSATWK